MAFCFDQRFFNSGGDLVPISLWLLVVGLLENIWFTGVSFALNSGDDKVAWANDVSTFERVDPAMIVHYDSAVFAGRLAVQLGRAVVADNLALAQERATSTMSMVSGSVVVGVVPAFEPLGCVDNDWLLTVFSHYLFLPYH